MSQIGLNSLGDFIYSICVYYQDGTSSGDVGIISGEPIENRYDLPQERNVRYIGVETNVSK